MTTTSEDDSRLGWNLVAGVASASWTAIITICTVPVYLHFLGVEAYGLIGFYTALQAMFAVLDLGLSQSISREIARAAYAHERAGVRDLLHTLALAYWAVAAAIAAGMWGFSSWISRHWLSTTIDPSTLSHVITLMGLTVACRFPLSLYLGALMGARRIALASGIEITMVTLANLGAIAILATISPTIDAFFVWQSLIAVINILVVRAAAWRALSAQDARAPRFDLEAIRRISRFSAGVAVTAIAGAIFVQGDKIVLGRIVSLADLGAYTVASIVARSLYVLTAPVFNAVYPQLSSLHGAGRDQDIEHLYRLGTRLLMAMLFPAAIFLTIFSTTILTVWTGDAELATRLPVVVGLLLLGTALNSAMHFPYALQLAFGRSHLSMWTNIVLLVLFVPLLVQLTVAYGLIGAAATWAILNALYLLLGTWLTHRSILPGVGWRWLSGDVGIPLLLGALIVGGGGVAVRSMHISHLAAAAIGLLLTAIAFATILFLNAGLATFARSLFAGRSPLLKLEA